MADWSQGGQGAVGGALSGAAMGSMFGPIGTGVGGLVGGGLGLLGGLFGNNNDAQRKQLQDYYNSIGAGRPAPQAGPAAQAGYSGFRTNQSNLVSRLEALSQGQGPSLAAQQFQQATDRNNSQQMAMAASGRGGPLSAFNAANNMATLGAQAAQGSAAARTQEQQMALNQLGLALQGARTSDEETNRFNAGQQNQMSQANLDARLKSMGMDDQTRLQILGLMNQANSQPGLGSQLLAGGAGMFGQYAAMQGNKQKPGAGDSNPYSSMAAGGGQSWGGTPMQDSIINPYAWGQGGGG